MKKNIGFKVALIILILSLITFIVGLIMALGFKMFLGNIVLFVSGIIELLIAFILCKIVNHKENYTCPVCGARRIHHRFFLRTVVKSQRSFKSNGFLYYKTEYEHQYRDTYECPECGNIKEITYRGSGGYYTKRSDGYIEDNTITPKEF